jgi:hypothetical protein
MPPKRQTPKPKSPENPFEPAFGRDILAKTKFVQAETEQHETKTRDQLALLFAFFIAAALLAGFILSLQRGDFAYLRAVWDVSSLFLGLIAGFYFRRHRKD